MISEPNKTFEVFFSYSHKDQDLRNQLETQLSLLKRQGFISSWHDRKIGAGEEWAKKINVHLNTAQIILLLISADFIASDYCYEKEMTRALERHESGEARVIPVILRPCDWHNSLFGKLQSLPTGGQPVTGRSWHSRDEAFSDVAKGIRKAMAELRASTASASVNNETSPYFSKTEFIEEKSALPKLKLSKLFNPYRTRDDWIVYITSNLQEAIKGEAYLDFYAEDVEGHKQIRILHNQNTIYALNIYKDAMGRRGGDDGISFSYATGRMTSDNGFNASGHFKWDAGKESVVLDLLDLSLLSVSYSGSTKAYTKEEFLKALWDRIRPVIENSTH